MTEEIILQKSRRFSIKPLKMRFTLFFSAFFILICVAAYYLFLGSANTFPNGKIVIVKKGQSVKEISATLNKAGIISFPSVLTNYIVLTGGENKVISGPYYFKSGEGIIPLSHRLTNGVFNIKPIKITFPEGITAKAMLEILSNNLPLLDSELFLKLTKNKEGYLFPNTYFFLPNITTEEVVETLSEEFDKNIFSLKTEILISGHDLNEIIIMASILEEEVVDFEDKKIVASIFWNRMKIGMPLQSDATLAYENGRSSAELTLTDLRTKTPYNSYTNKGLPPTPISNPGLESIKAAIHPTPSKYLYFLTDKQRKVHYAETFEGHKANKLKYLR